ncbi:ATP-binding protein [Desulfobacter sp.]|uniref:ATP-binding protein n=1 Tax=Desulfobacter sp. TaxID=2294 RepID=UPI003D0CF843
MIHRTVSDKTLQLASQYPVVTVTGPRQSGKTTLCKMLFPDKSYVSLENIDDRQFALNDPKGFLNKFPDGAVIDEIQRVPDLLSYIQTIVDEHQHEGMFIITGSQQFELMQHLSQSLAGRTALIRLLPFSIEEAYGQKAFSSLENTLYTGFYPRIFDKNLNPSEAMLFYVNTYVERDLRQLINIQDLSKFEVFLKLCAGRTGQILNLTSLGNDAGINHTTVKRWIGVLEASYIVKLLRPFYKNFNKRLVKSPKLYFLDSGLVSFLLDIQNETQMASHPLRGPIFEGLVVSELLKKRFNAGLTDNLYYFRDNTGNEVDIICDRGQELIPIEIKSGQTISSDFFKGLRFLRNLTDNIHRSYLVYGGNENYKREGFEVVGWQDFGKFISP